MTAQEREHHIEHPFDTYMIKLSASILAIQLHISFALRDGDTEQARELQARKAALKVEQYYLLVQYNLLIKQSNGRD